MLTRPKSPLRVAKMSIQPPSRRQRRLSPLMIIGISIPALLMLVAAGVFVVRPLMQSHAAVAAVNPNCTLIVPANPLTAQGLATPYQLTATDAAMGPCNQANATQSTFVQATIFDPAAGTFSVYSPLVIDQGTVPAAAPVVPVLPANATVALWTGFNGTNLTLQGAQANTLAQANCVNGLNQSVFGEFSYCNAQAFFTTVNAAKAAGQVQIPALGIAKDGMTCPTSRDFSVIDQDQSDNVQTQYLLNANGQTAQLNAANMANLPNAVVIGNPSDNALLTAFIDPALGCLPFVAPNLANPGTMVASLALDELQAANGQQAPIALVPLTDPMTMVNANQSLTKTNLYRLGVDQMPAFRKAQANGTTYCQNFVNTGIKRIQLDMNITMNATSPSPAMANSLFTFLAMRAQQSFINLNCQALLNMPNPVAVQTDANGVVIAATITLPNAAAAATCPTTTGNAAAAANNGNANNPAANNANNGNANANNVNGTNNGNAANNGNANNPNANNANGTNDMNNGNAANNGNANNPAANNDTTGMNNGNNAANNANTANGNGNAANTGTGNTGTSNGTIDINGTGDITVGNMNVAGNTVNNAVPANANPAATVGCTTTGGQNAPAAAGQTTAKNAPFQGVQKW